ncbi:hypothetical protein CFC21_071097 [Triticum aestivum]|uniref:CCT domain-containing protein n=3 Tax=Triticum TaxID=4564 RepID=A0A9R1AJU1_TRITD|nr:zinc finger protein CONSTANS-LIKE 12-like [Triticum aestivum]XP_044388197.1 zinc finger protein CONSTANS-LIKE 12-like [Triticum aestivum]KAF7064885.1 hypothetical protein CFC21_071097 [Triticum aestivum]VAI30368.1 unnamed protein product [Triticum turgidum subsp. durum]
MYHHHSSFSSSSYTCQGSNGFLPSQPSASSYGDLLQAEQHCYYNYSQQQQGQAPPFRHVLSTGDLGAPPPAAAAAGRYSTDERRERIEKYRSKRNQRNFQKKITYACRKTLADSRPRVKGRFARNVDDDAVADQPEFTAAEVSSMMSEANVVVGAVDAAASSSSSNMPEWWPAMQGALAMEDDELYIAVSSINLY